jgi:hypothetical protein
LARYNETISREYASDAADVMLKHGDEVSHDPIQLDLDPNAWQLESRWIPLLYISHTVYSSTHPSLISLSWWCRGVLHQTPQNQNGQLSLQELVDHLAHHFQYDAVTAEVSIDTMFHNAVCLLREGINNTAMRPLPF